MRASQHHDQRRYRERRRLARITVLTGAGGDLSLIWLCRPAPDPRPPRPERRTPPTQALPAWRAGDKVHWYGYIGMFLRDTDDDNGHAEPDQRSAPGRNSPRASRPESSSGGP